MDSARKVEPQVFLSLLVLVGVAAVAYADHSVVTVSLGYLYFLPLALSSLIHRVRTSLLLAFICVFLTDWFGPYEHSGWQPIVRNFLALVGFTTVVIFVNHLSRRRSELAALAQRQKDQLAEELELAVEVQRRLLPSHPPALEKFELAGQTFPARALGGDYYDYIELPNGHLGLVIADVSGKGVPAALFMPSVRIAIRSEGITTMKVEDATKRINNLIYELTDEERFVSLFYGIVDTQSCALHYTNAGHLPPLLFTVSSSEAQWLEPGGPVLGLFPNASFESASVELHPGDLLLLYTDGVIEAHNQVGEEYSRERLLSVVKSHHSKTAQEVLAATYASVIEFTGTNILEDDLTVLVLKAV